MPLRNFIFLAVAIVVSLACYHVTAKNRYANLFAEALTLVEKESLYPKPSDQLFISAMNGMLQQLDEHSMFVSGTRYTNMESDIRQEFGGIGLYLEVDSETSRVFVLATVPQTPAFDAGIQIGDYITHVDGQEIAGMTREQVIKLLRGPIHRPVKVRLLREENSFEKELVRAAINTPSVTGDYQTAAGQWRFQLREYPRIGYIRLQLFGEKSAKELKQALQELPEGAAGVILDLRNNSGGLLDVAIEICDFFLPPQKMIVGVKRRDQEIEYTYSAKKSLVPADLPMVILINRYSASASEVLAGCLQDHGRAIVIGERSFGKATVQNFIPMQRGVSALKLTTASYWRPSGKPIDRRDELFKESQAWGVQPDPDFQVDIDERDILNMMRDRNIRDLEGLMGSDNSELMATVKRLRKQLFESLEEELKNRQRNSPEPESPDEEESDEVEPFVDPTLQRAIEYLKSRGVGKKAA